VFSKANDVADASNIASKKAKALGKVAGAPRSASSSTSAKPGNLKRDHKMANVGNKN